jgi:peptidyl-prolyl cis-trans isomerase SurA
MRPDRLRAPLLAALLWGAGATLLPAGPAHAEVIDRIAALVNDRVITLSDVYRLLPVYTQVAGVDPRRLSTVTGRQEVAAELLEFLIDTTLMRADADTRELAITAAEVDRFVAQQEQSLGLTHAQFLAEIQRQGIVEADFRDLIEANLTRLRMLQIDVLGDLFIDESDVERALQQRYPDGLVELFLSSSHILVMHDPADPEGTSARARIDALRDRLMQGEAFETLASEVNPDASRNTGGRLGSFRVNELDPDYTRAALALEPGTVSEPVLTQFGWHLIRLDRMERREVRNPDQIRDRIYEELHAEQADGRIRVYVERLRSQAWVRVMVTEFP